jgi:hypothetical protein
MVLGRRPLKLPEEEEGQLGKYGLCVGERGLVGGDSNGEVRCGMCVPSFRDVGWS